MSQFVDLEKALEAMSQDIHFQLVEAANEETKNKAKSIARKIDFQVTHFFRYLESMFPFMSVSRKIGKYGARWKPLSDSWKTRKLKKGIDDPNYFVGVTKFKEQTEVEPLRDYIESLNDANQGASFLGKTEIYNDILEAWNPSDARIISWTTRTGKTQSRWFGSRRSGGQGFIRTPSDKDLNRLQLRIMPHVFLNSGSAVGEMTDSNLTEKQLAFRFENLQSGGRGQRIKVVGRNRQLLAPTVRWLYNTEIRRILREAAK